MAAQILVDSPKNTKSMPDLAKINSMTAPRLQAVKRLKVGSREMLSGIKLEPEGQSDQIRGLYDSLRARPDGGGGIYEFEVFDEDGNEKDKWIVTLGAEESEGVSDVMSAIPVSTPGAAPNAQAQHLGNGYWFTPSASNPDEGFITTPQRQMHWWKRGDPMPWTSSNSLPTAPAASTVPAGFPAMGGMPANNDREKFLEEQLANERARQKEEQHAREISEMKSQFDKIIAETNARTEKLLQELTTKKSDPESEALKEQNRILQQQLSEEKREREAQRREDTLRAEIQATNARMEKLMTELSANKTDPTMTMMANVLQTIQSSNTTMFSAMEKASSNGIEASREQMRQIVDRLQDSLMKPDKAIELLRMAKDRGPEDQLQRQFGDILNTVMGAMKNVVQLQMDTAPATPLWAQLLQQGMDQVGSLGQTFMQHKVQQSEAEQRRMAVAAANARARAAQQAHQAPQAPPAASPAPTATVHPMPVSQAAEPQDGFDDDEEEDDGVTAVAGNPDPNHPDAIRARAAAEVNSRQNDAPTAAPVAPDAVVMSDGVVRDSEGNPVLPAGMTPEAVIEMMAAKSTEEIRQYVNQEAPTDAAFFGFAAGKLPPLRSQVAAGKLDPPGVARTLIQAKQVLQGAQQFPPALEVLSWGHYTVLVERVIPDADPLFRGQVVEALAEMFEQASAA